MITKHSRVPWGENIRLAPKRRRVLNSNWKFQTFAHFLVNQTDPTRPLGLGLIFEGIRHTRVLCCLQFPWHKILTKPHLFRNFFPGNISRREIYKAGWPEKPQVTSLQIAYPAAKTTLNRWRRERKITTKPYILVTAELKNHRSVHDVVILSRPCTYDLCAFLKEAKPLVRRINIFRPVVSKSFQSTWGEAPCVFCFILCLQRTYHEQERQTRCTNHCIIVSPLQIVHDYLPWRKCMRTIYCPPGGT